MKSFSIDPGIATKNNGIPQRTNLIAPEEIMQAYKIDYSKSHLAERAKSQLEESFVNLVHDYLIVPPPPLILTTASLINLAPKLFDLVQFSAYLDEFPEVSMLQVPSTWTALRIEKISSSVGKNLRDQTDSLSLEDRLASAPELLWCLASLLATRRTTIMPSVFLKTSTLNRWGGRIAIGGVTVANLHITTEATDFRLTNFGFATVRKAP